MYLTLPNTPVKTAPCCKAHVSGTNITVTFSEKQNKLLSSDMRAIKNRLPEGT